MNMTHDQPVRSCKRITVTEVVCVVGNGTSDSPVREAKFYYDDEGWLLAKHDLGADAVFGSGEVLASKEPRS
jgi:hypothetical protein